jgi:ribosome-binding protein aMBF1 (putative translation factor)
MRVSGSSFCRVQRGDCDVDETCCLQHMTICGQSTVDFTVRTKNIAAMEIAKRIAHNLIEQREKRGLTPEQLAEMTSVSLARIEALEAGEEQPELETISKLATSLGLPTDALAEGLTWVPGEGFTVTDPS